MAKKRLGPNQCCPICGVPWSKGGGQYDHRCSQKFIDAREAALKGWEDEDRRKPETTESERLDIGFMLLRMGG